MNDYLVTVLSNIGMISFIALSAYLLLLVGEISFGQQAFFAISAYMAGIATAMWGWNFWFGLLFGTMVAAIAAVLVGIPVLRLRGLYFSIATLAFAEMVRLIFHRIRYQIEIGGELVGPNGAEGFREIRYIFEHNISPLGFMLMIYSLLLAVLLLLLWLEQSKLGTIFRMIGQDELLIEMQGVDVTRYKLMATGLAGFVAGIGGALYAHFATFVEPNVFNVMLGVHALAYGLIGGLGTVIGPLLGVAIDIGFLQAIQGIAGYRMIVFGGLVALLLIIMPRGILDEKRVYRMRHFFKQWAKLKAIDLSRFRSVWFGRDQNE